MEVLTRDPLVAGFGRLALARLVGAMERVECTPGEVLCAAGQAAEHLYLIESGAAVLTTPSGRQAPLHALHCGEEAAAGLANYTCTVTATSQVIAWRLPRAALADVAQLHPTLATEALLSLASTLGGEAVGGGVGKGAAGTKWVPLTRREIGGWMAAIVLPAGIYFGCVSGGFTSQSALFAAILGMVVVMWLFAIVDEFIPPIIAIVATLFVGLAPPSVALGGFASPSLMTMIGVFALASTIASSGLSYRVMLWVLARLPDRPFWQQTSMLLGGMALSPIVPSGNSRLSILLPLYRDMADGLRLPPRSTALTALMAATLSGALLFSPMMATSKPSSIATLNLLSVQAQHEFSGLFWLVAAGVAMVGLVGFHFLFMRWLLPAENPNPLPKERIRGQLHLLGPLGFAEWLALGSFVAFLVGTATVSLHHVQPSWIAGCVLVTLLVCGSLGKMDFRKQLDWPMVFFLLGIDGLVRIMSYLKVDALIAKVVSGHLGFIDGSMELFVLAALVITVALRIGLPISASALVSAVILIPVAEANHINPWICIFLAALFSDIWFFPYQSSVWMQAASRGQTEAIDRVQFTRYNQCMNAARVAVAFLSIPYWKWLELQ
jgi:di/tricarboxylate transporter